MGPTMDQEILWDHFTNVLDAAAALGDRRRLRAARSAAARERLLLPQGRLGRAADGMGGGVRGGRSASSARLAPVRAPSGPADHAAHDAGAGATRRASRSKPAATRHRLVHGLEDLLLGPARATAITRRAAPQPPAADRMTTQSTRRRAGRVPEPVLLAPAVPDRRQLRRHRRHRRDAAAEPRRRDRRCCPLPRAWTSGSTACAPAAGLKSTSNGATAG